MNKIRGRYHRYPQHDLRGGGSIILNKVSYPFMIATAVGTQLVVWNDEIFLAICDMVSVHKGGHDVQ